MDFGKIYEEWESKRAPKKKEGVQRELENWLDKNPIPPDVIDGRDEENPHPSRLKAVRRAQG